MVMGELYIGPRPANLSRKEEIVGVTLQDVEVGMKISTTITCSMLEKVLMALVEVHLGLGPALIPPIIHVIMLDHLI